MKVIERVIDGHDLSPEESEEVFAAVMAGDVSELHLCALLVGLRAKGETPAEIAGAARAMRAAATPLEVAMDVADSCGTGGDGARTVNISTAAAFVAAAAGLPVAKHGNRSVSSQCGSADVLERAGVRIDAPPDVSARCLKELNVAFLFAPQYHPGVRHAMPVRRGLGMRTLFNLLGPLANPAAPTYQLVGVYDPSKCRVMAETLGMLGCRRAMVVHGDGLDEIALHADTHAALLIDGEVEERTLSVDDLGVSAHPLSALRGGAPEEAAGWLRSFLGGEGEAAHVDAVAANAGALLWVAERADTLREGVEQARTLLREGKPLEVLEGLAAC